MRNVVGFLLLAAALPFAISPAAACEIEAECCTASKSCAPADTCSCSFSCGPKISSCTCQCNVVVDPPGTNTNPQFNPRATDGAIDLDESAFNLTVHEPLTVDVLAEFLTAKTGWAFQIPDGLGTRTIAAGEWTDNDTLRHVLRRVLGEAGLRFDVDNDNRKIVVYARR